MNQNTRMRHIALLSVFLILSAVSERASAQGTWTPLTNMAPDPNFGVMLLLSDGSVIVKTSASSSAADMYGDTWDRLTPDSNGSYANGTWSTIAPMDNSRLYFSSQILRDGRVYVAGGEYGSGSGNAEVYDPVIDAWTPVPTFSSTGLDTFYDANSAMLPDGRVLQAVLSGDWTNTYIYNPATNSFSAGPAAHGVHAESVWLTLKDNSVLFADDTSLQTERYIPAVSGTGSWVMDALSTQILYDYTIGETGSAQLLPNGKAIFFGGSGNTQYYTPSGTAAPGSWAPGPHMPTGKGTPDAPSVMMANGKILCAVSDTDDIFTPFPAPTYFYEFDYITNSWTTVPAPVGGDTLSTSSFETSMLPLPDGNILFSDFYSQQYYIYTPTDTPLAAGKPIVDTIIRISCTKYMATGHLFNGIALGATYGDDWQMASNYPIVRLTSGTHVYYARSYNWNSNGLQRGSLNDTTYFDLPAGLPDGRYGLQVVANGNPSASRSFSTCGVLDVAGVTEDRYLRITPNPASTDADITFHSAAPGPYTIKLIDITGRTMLQQTGNAHAGANTTGLHLTGLASGVYSVFMNTAEGVQNSTLVVE